MAPLNALNEQKPRQIAARILGRRHSDGGFTEDLLEQAFARERLTAQDRALCQELVYGVVRWRATLDWLIAQKTNGRKQKPALQNLLRLGLYQIFWLGRIPNHAAVNETVELAKQAGFGPQAGFVNAILRGYLREFEETKQQLAELKKSSPAIGWSHPGWLVKKWQKRFGAEKTAELLEWNNTPPKTFARVNNLKADASKLLEKWRAENVGYDLVRRDFLGRAGSPLPAGSGGGTSAGAHGVTRPAGFEYLVFELKAHRPLATLASFREGWFYVQDPSTLLAPLLLAPQPGETILDLCAAPGGKTTFIAQLMNNEGKIVACDVSAMRLKLLRENCVRLGVTCVEPILASAFSLRPSAFDRILVDAPCSNTGVLRRRVDLRWRVQPKKITRLQQTQLDLLRCAAAKLKPGGILIYSTCSLEPEENAGVVKAFLRAHTHFKLESQRELLPFNDRADGTFVARLICLA